MAEISAKDVMSLRNRTGLGMMECKKALVETGGNVEEAEEFLRKRYKGKMEKRADRAAGEGRIAIKVADDGSAAALVELKAETDFTAKNENFIACADVCADEALAASDFGSVSMTPAMETAIDKIRAQTGENISLARGSKMSGGGFGKYIHHDSKLGVLLQFEGDLPEDVATGICQHIAAHVPTPMAVDETGLPAELVSLKMGEAKAEAENSGKPAEIAEKIAQGKIRKFYEEVTLLGQKFVRDETQQIKDLLPAGTSLTAFKRLQVGGTD